MLQSLRTRFVGGQETVNVDDEGKVDFSEAVDGDDFVLVDVLPSPDQEGPAVESAPSSLQQGLGLYQSDPNVITEQPVARTETSGFIHSDVAQPSSYVTQTSQDQQQQAWVLRPQDLPFWLSAKLQALASCQRLANTAAAETRDQAMLRPFLRDNSMHDVVDEQSLAKLMSSPELNYDFQAEKQVVAFDQSVFLQN
ncbi:uncharacterized protein LOC135824460 [Sycon ciliatum]|uniref:uncharacterized protein LOC135824460 n=1 Tax=Sycon ciliatum TaxID=27933 RepID=UPI0031F62A15